MDERSTKGDTMKKIDVKKINELLTMIENKRIFHNDWNKERLITEYKDMLTGFEAVLEGLKTGLEKYNG